MTIAIRARELRKIYQRGTESVRAVNGVDLDIESGEFVAIMGPSGSGKTTLLQILAGLDVPSEGRVLVDEQDLASLTDDGRTLMRRRRIGFVFQSFNLMPSFSAQENVALPLSLDGVSKAESRERAVQALERVGMAQRRSHLPSELSGGEQQRVAIARALVIRPAAIMADEPTGNLDSRNGAQIIALVRKLVDDERQTVVVVTHDQAVADAADRVIRLRDGVIEAQRTRSSVGRPSADERSHRE